MARYQSEEWYDERDDMRREAAFERRRTTYQYHCSDRMCGASDCGNCRNGAPPWEEQDEDEEQSVQRVKLVIARKARGSILPGDCVRVTSGFTYAKDGPRTGYFKFESLVGYGPGHGEKAGTGTWPKGREYKAAA